MRAQMQSWLGWGRGQHKSVSGALSCSALCGAGCHDPLPLPCHELNNDNTDIGGTYAEDHSK